MIHNDLLKFNNSLINTNRATFMEELVAEDGVVINCSNKNKVVDEKEKEHEILQNEAGT